MTTSDDVPGLITEAATHEERMEMLQPIVPELLELGRDHLPGRPEDMREVPMSVMHQQISQIRIPA